MNPFLSSALATVFVLSTAVSFGQSRDFNADSPLPCNLQYGNHSSAATGARMASTLIGGRTTDAGLPQYSLTDHEYNASIPSSGSDRGVKGYTVVAVVIPVSAVFDPVAERVFRTTAPTKSAAMSRMRQTIDAVGVPVRVVSIEFVNQQ